MQDEQDKNGLPPRVIEVLKLLAQNNLPEELAGAMGIGQGRVDELLAEVRRMYDTKDLAKIVSRVQKDATICNCNK